MEASVAEAIECWRELYGGQLQALPVPVPGVAAAAVRRDDFRPDPGNWPRILHHSRVTDRVLVLIHGFKDSPGYLDAVARRFAAHGVNVVLPLLPGHGCRDPVSAMRHADFRAWRSTVDRTVRVAAALGRELSIGGLSTGGALALDKCLRDPTAVTGKVFLFAAALGLSLPQRLVLATPLLPRLADAWMRRHGETGIGGNPLKYSLRFLTAGRQVLLLIKDLRRRAGAPLAPAPLDRIGYRGRIFVAHSEADRTIPFSAVRALIETGDPGQHHVVPEALGVAHAELVMAAAMSYRKLRAGEPDPPRANPELEPMIQKALAFLDRAPESAPATRLSAHLR